MAAGISEDLLRNLAAADYHDTTDPAALAGHAHNGCPCWTDAVAGAFAMRLVTGDLTESVLDGDLGVVVVPLEDITGTPDTGQPPAPGHPESVPPVLMSLTVRGSLEHLAAGSLSPDIDVTWHPPVTGEQAHSLLAFAWSKLVDRPWTNGYVGRVGDQ